MPARKRRRKRTPKTTIFGALGLEVASLLAIVAVAQPAVIANMGKLLLKPLSNPSITRTEGAEPQVDPIPPESRPDFEHRIARFHPDTRRSIQSTYR